MNGSGKKCEHCECLIELLAEVRMAIAMGDLQPTWKTNEVPKAPVIAEKIQKAITEYTYRR